MMKKAVSLDEEHRMSGRTLKACPARRNAVQAHACFEKANMHIAERRAAPPTPGMMPRPVSGKPGNNNASKTSAQYEVRLTLLEHLVPFKATSMRLESCDAQYTDLGVREATPPAGLRRAPAPALRQAQRRQRQPPQAPAVLRAKLSRPAQRR